MLVTKRQAVILLSVLFLLTCLTYFNRYPTGDDAWFAEQSYWLQKEGIIRSEFFRGILGWENQLLVSHKLFLAVGAVLINLFGFGLPTVQFVGLIPFCFILAGLVFYIQNDKKADRSYYLSLILIVVFSNRLLIKMSFENRPELLLAALGFWSFLCVRSEKNTFVKAAFAGFLGALALLCHLNGVIYLVAGCITYVSIRKYRQAILFSLVGGLTALTYFIDVIQAKDGFSIWLYQFRHDPATQSAFGLYSKLIVLLTFPKLFFESPEQAALSLLLIFILWHQRQLIKQLPFILKTYSILVVVAFWILTKNGSGTYLPLFMPFMFILIYELYARQPFTTWGLKLVLVIYFVIGIYGTVEIIYENFVFGNFPIAYKKLRKHIPQHSNGLVPLTFFFNEYEQYAHLVCHENFTYYSNRLSDLPGWANQHKVDFILMDYQYRREPFYPEPGTNQLPFYRLAFFDGRFAVYLKQ